MHNILVVTFCFRLLNFSLDVLSVSQMKRTTQGTHLVAPRLCATPKKIDAIIIVGRRESMNVDFAACWQVEWVSECRFPRC